MSTIPGLFARGLAAAKPASASPGANYFETDTKYQWQWNGSAWVMYSADEMTGDSGSGGARGLVPAPAAGDAAAGKFLKADKTWAVPAGGSGFGENAIVYHDTTQSLTNSTWTALNFNQEDADTASFHDTSSNNNRLTIPTGKGGLYLVCAHVSFAASASGDRFVAIVKNNQSPGDGTNALRLYNRSRSTTAFECQVTVAGLIRLAQADYIQCFALQNSGGSLNVGHATTPDLRNGFELVRLNS